MKEGIKTHAASKKGHGHTLRTEFLQPDRAGKNTVAGWGAPDVEKGKKKKDKVEKELTFEKERQKRKWKGGDEERSEEVLPPQPVPKAAASQILPPQPVPKAAASFAAGSKRNLRKLSAVNYQGTDVSFDDSFEDNDYEDEEQEEEGAPQMTDDDASEDDDDERGEKSKVEKAKGKTKRMCYNDDVLTQDEEEEDDDEELKAKNVIRKQNKVKRQKSMLARIRQASQENSWAKFEPDQEDLEWETKMFGK